MKELQRRKLRLGVSLVVEDDDINDDGDDDYDDDDDDDDSPRELLWRSFPSHDLWIYDLWHRSQKG